ncbi:MAG: tetratricopeptide repeat protein, partial [Deltaproteobacteria bacterium]|nr:tetratricopeptide repeat protein [Deltaproteobacteria bacterium]
RMLSTAMSQYVDVKAVGATRFEVESAIRETLDDCNRQAKLRDVLTPAGGSTPTQLRYVRGKEAMLARLFAGLAINLEQTRRQEVQQGEQEWLERRQRLSGKALELLAEGELHKGLAFIHRVLEECGDHDPDLHLTLAESLDNAGLHTDAADILSQAIDHFPRETSLYGAAIKMYAEIGRLDRVETIFHQGVKQFGPHPHNLLSMARIYAEAGQRAKAVSLLYRLLQDHPDYEEGKALLARVEFR